MWWIINFDCGDSLRQEPIASLGFVWKIDDSSEQKNDFSPNFGGG